MGMIDSGVGAFVTPVGNPYPGSLPGGIFSWQVHALYHVGVPSP